MTTKFTFFPLALAGALLAFSLPATRGQSQLPAAPGDPVAQLQALQTANEDLLKRQETTLKELTDMTDAANEIRIFSRRG